jgi:Na+-transporting NADH:ubiquinone oxidoreductase subunit A
MAHIKISKGLDIPIKGKPEGKVQSLIPGGEASALSVPHQLALNLDVFENTKFRLLVKVGDTVKLGQPLVEDKDSAGRMFVSPAGGVVREIRRGLKRRLLDIVIDVARQEESEQHSSFNLHSASREELIEYLKLTGIFALIRQRPFNFLANPQKMPRSIFVKAVESSPFMPPAELQVAGHEKEFQAGLDALAKLTFGVVHLVYRQGSQARAFVEAKNVQIHTVEGPHPVSNVSLHIQALDPIRSPEDVVWTINAHDVVAMGHQLLHGRHFTDRVISVAGPGIIEERAGYFRVREGYPIAPLIAGRIQKGLIRLISGDILTGKKVESEDFLGFYDYSLCAIPENMGREFLHFFRLGLHKYTFTGAYLSGHLDNSHRLYDFTTNQHGERRAFIDGHLYDEVMPLNIPTMHLMKAVMAEDYDTAAHLGLLEVDPEDFALPTFICPSKIEMMDIIKRGQQRYAADILK